MNSPRLLFLTLQNIDSARRPFLIMNIAFMILGGILESASISILVPLLDSFNSSEKNKDFSFSANFLDISLSQRDSILFFSIILAIVVVLTCLCRVYTAKRNLKASALIGNDFAVAIYKNYLSLPYIEFSRLNSSDIINAIVNQVELTVIALNSFFMLSTSLIISGFILTSLLTINLSSTIALMLLIGSAYIILSRLVRSRMKKNSSIIARNCSLIVKELQETSGLIKEIMVNETMFDNLSFFKNIDVTTRQTMANNALMGLFPRYFLEMISLVGLSFFVCVFIGSYGLETFLSFAPLIGVFLFAAQKLIPLFQQIYSGWAAINSSATALQNVLTLSTSPPNSRLEYSTPINNRELTYTHQHPTSSSLSVRDLSFSYSDHNLDTKSLTSINFEIPIGTSNCFIGKTGCGKTTLFDLLMGLLTPASGSISFQQMEISSTSLQEDLVQWRHLVSHVSQSIFLKDATIRDNILLSKPSGSCFDPDLFYRAVEAAQLTDLIENIQDGLDFVVGERGCLLSGGQQQRIALARALYRNTPLLFLDEATSALDSRTEENVLLSISKYYPETTLLMISHSANIAPFFDSVYTVTPSAVKKVPTNTFD